MNIIKNIEELPYSESLKELNSQNKTFNIKDFYLNNGAGAVGLITPQQIIYTYAKTNHEQVTKQILKHLYPGFEDFILYDQSILRPLDYILCCAEQKVSTDIRKRPEVIFSSNCDVLKRK